MKDLEDYERVNKWQLTAALAVGLALLWIVWEGFVFWQSPLGLELRPHVESYGKLLGGVLAFIATGALIWRTSVADRQARVAARQAETAAKQAATATKLAELTERGQVTDRFTKAIDQLGNRSAIAIRLGGIFSLENIANDSGKYRAVVAEVLSAYVRVCQDQKGEEQGKKGEVSDQDVALTDEAEDLSEKPVPLDTDVIAALLILDRNNLSIDLREVDFRGAYVATAIKGAKLDNADFSRAVIAGADLRGASLEYASFENSLITGRATLSGANLSNGYCMRARFEVVDFSDANLEFANLCGARFSMANFRGANLRGVKFSNADLKGLSACGAILNAADLRGANLEKCSLSQRQIDVTIGDDTTVLPPRLQRPKHWGRPEKDQTEAIWEIEDEQSGKEA